MRKIQLPFQHEYCNSIIYDISNGPSKMGLVVLPSKSNNYVRNMLKRVLKTLEFFAHARVNTCISLHTIATCICDKHVFIFRSKATTGLEQLFSLLTRYYCLRVLLLKRSKVAIYWSYFLK